MISTAFCTSTVFLLWFITIIADGSTHHVQDELSLSSSSSSIAQDATSKPNIVVLFADNLGYNDIGYFGAPTARTPHVDRIGREGIKLNNWNSVAHLCSASRAALLTGKYPIRTGIYPGTFKRDSVYGMLPTEMTLAEYLSDEGYVTAMVGKWHLGHRPEFLPTNQGFDSWLGIPYHASGGSIDDHVCHFDVNETLWLPLYDGETIVQQPVRMQDLAQVYATRSRNSIFQAAAAEQPLFLYMAFSHVHQLCAPRDYPEQETCQWGSKGFKNATFVDAVEEMDWITGQILDALDEAGIDDNTFVLFTSDNGPWVAEQSCSGSKGPFEGRWLIDNVALNCTACPRDYVPSPTDEEPRRCVLPGTEHSLIGVHCGQDTGLGSLWEANLRMPTVARWPGKIKPATESMALLSSLDLVPTVLSFIGSTNPLNGVDGIDVSSILFGDDADYDSDNRILFLWRDGFQEGPLEPPFGRFDVAAVKMGRIKAWFSTKSGHYNNDTEVFHDPPLLFDILKDPAEAFPLDPNKHMDFIDRIKRLVEEHKESVDWTFPLTLFHDHKYIPCVNEATGCRTNEINLEETEVLPT